MKNYNYIFIDTVNSSKRILGRSARDYVLREFDVSDSATVLDARDAGDLSLSVSDLLCADAVNVVLSLDMPLVSKITVERLLRRIRANGVKSVRLGASDSISRIVVGREEHDGFFCNDEDFFTIDSAKSYSLVYTLLKDRIADAHLARGVVIWDKSSVHIDDTVQIERGAEILPFSRLLGNSEVCEGAAVSASVVEDSKICAGARVELSHLAGSTVGARATVGPYARLRNAEVGEGCRIGDFVEVKASALCDGVKCAHLTYVGDAEVGEGTNIGCGTVFCNYDGKLKHRTSVGKGCFIGANTNLIAPLTVGDNAFIAAGTTVSRDVEDGTFTIGRVRQTSKQTKEGGAK